MASSHRITDLGKIPVRISKNEAPTPLSVAGPLFISSLLFHLPRTLLGGHFAYLKTLDFYFNIVLLAVADEETLRSLRVGARGRATRVFPFPPSPFPSPPFLISLMVSVDVAVVVEMLL